MEKHKWIKINPDHRPAAGHAILAKLNPEEGGTLYYVRDVNKNGFTVESDSTNGVTMDFSRPGKPTDNPYVESFNGKLRDECLNVNWFLSLEDAAQKIEDFRWEYNHFRPHSSINDLTPKEFIILNENTLETLTSVV